jgi:hypothetical protein
VAEHGAAQGGRHRNRRERACDRHHHGRLRTDPFRRPQGARDRRGACRLEGRADRCPGIHHRRDGEARRRQPSYEVGAEFVERFINADAENALFFLPGERNGHAQFDLAGFIRMRLENAGVLMIDDVGIDTYSDERFYSYRRSVHRKEPDYGRHVHAIALEAD